MTGRTHDLAAITLLGAVVVSLPLPSISLATAVMAFFANQIGGILPDIDQPMAPFWRNLPVGGPIGRVITRMMGGHRFITHSLLGVGIICFLAYDFLAFLSPIMSSVNIDLVWWAFVIGVFSHLLMDSFTKEGVPWLLPLPFKFGFPPLKRLRVTTGKWVEMFMVFPGLILIAAGLCYANYGHIVTLVKQHLVR